MIYLEEFDCLFQHTFQEPVLMKCALEKVAQKRTFRSDDLTKKHKCHLKGTGHFCIATAL